MIAHIKACKGSLYYLGGVTRLDATMKRWMVGQAVAGTAAAGLGIWLDDDRLVSRAPLAAEKMWEAFGTVVDLDPKVWTYFCAVLDLDSEPTTLFHECCDQCLLVLAVVDAASFKEGTPWSLARGNIVDHLGI